MCLIKNYLVYCGFSLQIGWNFSSQIFQPAFGGHQGGKQNDIRLLLWLWTGGGEGRELGCLLGKPERHKGQLVLNSQLQLTCLAVCPTFIASATLLYRKDQVSSKSGEES